MKIVSSLFSGVIESGENRFTSLVVESPALFRRIIAAFQGLPEVEGELLVSSDDKLLNLSKSVELVSSFVPFGVNSKEITAELLKRLEKVALARDNYAETQELLLKIGKRLQEWALELPLPIDFAKPSALAVIKAFSPFFDSQSQELPDLLYDYLALCRELLSKKLFVLVNSRSYLTECEIERLLDKALPEKFNLLLLDSFCHSKLGREDRFIIDKDLCEIGFDDLA